MMADGDELMKKLMLEMLLDEIPKIVELLYQYFEDADWDELRRLSHRSKTLFAATGNELLASTNQDIEKILRTGIGFNGLAELFRILDKIYPRVLEELRSEQEMLEAFA